MAKVNYSFYLLKLISKKWGLLVTSLISLIAIVVIYSVAFKGAEKNYVSNELWGIKTFNQSALTQNPMTLAVVFITMIPFVVYLTWVIFVETNNSTELVLLSRNASRVSMIIQRYLMSILILFAQSLIAFIIFKVESLKDLTMSSSETNSWAVSMFFGYFIVSICIMSIALFLSNFMKFITLITTIIALSLAMPVATIVLSSNRNIVTFERLADDALNFSGINKKRPDNFGFTDEYEVIAREYETDAGEQTRSYKRIFIRYDADIDGQKFGAKTPMDKMFYQEYAKWDAWMGVSSIFNVFANGKAKNKLRDSWTEKKQVTNLIKFTDNNSIEIDGKRYMMTYPSHGLKYDGTAFQRADNEKFIAHYKEGTVLARMLNYRYSSSVFINDWIRKVLIPEKMVQEQRFGHSVWIKLQGKETKEEIHLEHPENIATNYAEIINLLNTNDVYASKYKSLPFAYQATLLMALINAYDEVTMTAQEKFDAALNLLNEKVVVDNFDKFGFALAQIIDNANKDRFMPNKMYPESEKWNRLSKRSTYYSGGSLADGKFRGIISSDMSYNEPHYNEEYESGNYIQIILLVFMLMTIPLSAFIYIRKDLK